MQKALTVGGGIPPPPLARSAPSHVIFTAPPPLKLNPGYATGRNMWHAPRLKFDRPWVVFYLVFIHRLTYLCNSMFLSECLKLLDPPL